jgi:hypothetical protein
MAELLEGAMMAINGIQFQKALSLSAFFRDFGTEEQCEVAFIKARWPRGFICPCCGNAVAYEFKRRGLRYWQCSACRKQTSLRSRESGSVPHCDTDSAIRESGSVAHCDTDSAIPRLRASTGNCPPVRALTPGSRDYLSGQNQISKALK